MLIVPGSNFTRQSMELAKRLGAEVVEVEKKVFPDGELYVRLKGLPSDLGSTCVAVANTMYPSQDTALVETLLLLNAVHKAGGKDVVLVAPYLPYMRQDKVFLQGEPVSAEVVLEVLTRTIKRGLVVDVHNPSVLENRPWTNILVSDMLVAQALKYVNDPIVMAPDKGALERAGFAASKLNLEFDYLIKERDRVTGEVTVKPKSVSVAGRDVVIVDDIISTGGTLAEAAKFLRSQGARRIVVAATHGLLVGGAMRKMDEAGFSKIILADTLGVTHNSPSILYVSVVERISGFLREVCLER